MLTSTRPRLVLLLLIVFAANMIETSWETSLRTASPITEADFRGAYAVQQFEPEFVNFEFHDMTSRWAMYAWSVAYFILFPVLALGVLMALARRPEIAPFRVLCVAVAIDYLVCLPWFLLFPVPERWAHPESDAVLLSDQWSSALINSIRPLSALNNSFPSTHVSLTVVLIVVCWVFHVRLRSTITALGGMVVLATFALGIHWVADIMAGIAVGVLSVAAAWRFTDTTERGEYALQSALALPSKPRPLRQLAPAGGVR